MNLISINHITLSRRNLLTLIKMLDEKVGEPTLRRTVDDAGVVLRVTAEEDSEHYNSETRAASVRGAAGVGPEHVKDGYVAHPDSSTSILKG